MNDMEVLAHTETNGRFVTSEKTILAMASQGLLLDHGPQKLAGGLHYLTLAAKGRRALRDWRKNHPKPKPLTRDQRRYQAFLRADMGCTFIAFLKMGGGKIAHTPHHNHHYPI